MEDAEEVRSTDEVTKVADECIEYDGECDLSRDGCDSLGKRDDADLRVSALDDKRDERGGDDSRLKHFLGESETVDSFDLLVLSNKLFDSTDLIARVLCSVKGSFFFWYGFGSVTRFTSVESEWFR